MLRLMASLKVISSAAFKVVVPNLPTAGSFVAWVHVNLPFRSLEVSEEPVARAQLIVDTRHRSPSWSSVWCLAADLGDEAWSTALSRMQSYRGFLERIWFQKDLCESKSGTVRVRILETCAVHLDYMVFMRSASLEGTRAAAIRSVFTKNSIPSRRIEVSCSDRDDTSVKRILSTLLSGAPPQRLENMLILEVWSYVDETPGKFHAAAAAVYGMLLLDLLRDCGPVSIGTEHVSEIYRMILEGASAAIDDDAQPPIWFSVLAAFSMGISGRPTSRCRTTSPSI